MVEFVPRHEIPTDKAARAVELLDAEVHESVDDVESDPTELGSLLDTALIAAQAHCLLDPRASKLETWEAFVAAMQTGSALFASASAIEGEVQCRIADELRTIPATGPRSDADAGNWITAFWLTVICREQGRMDMLSTVPLDLLRASGAAYDEYIYSWVDSLQTYWQETPDLVEKMRAAVEGTDPEVLRIADRELMLYILYPPIEMFYYFIRQDTEKFNASLAQALRLHKSYWTDNEERATDISGTIALGPLAVTCLAHDSGFPIEFESEYLPKHLIERSWVGEFET